MTSVVDLKCWLLRVPLLSWPSAILVTVVVVAARNSLLSLSSPSAILVAVIVVAVRSSHRLGLTCQSLSLAKMQLLESNFDVYFLYPNRDSIKAKRQSTTNNHSFDVCFLYPNRDSIKTKSQSTKIIIHLMFVFYPPTEIQSKQKVNL